MDNDRCGGCRRGRRVTVGGRRRTDPGSWGVQTEYVDAMGTRRTVSPDTVRSLLEAMGADGKAPPRSGPVVVSSGDPLPAAHSIQLEDGREVQAPRLCRGLPFGYHTLVPKRGEPRRLIVSPGRCHLPQGRGWGWAAQLYALRSARSWGMGDLGDLRSLARWSRGLGAGFVLVNPLHAPLPRLPQQPSPYYPSSRMYRNPLYIRIDDVPGARHDPGLAALARRGRELNRLPLLERDRVFTLKMEGLRRLWRRFEGDRRFDAYRAEHGLRLLRYATFCVLSEEHGAPWPWWPEDVRRADAAGVANVAGRRRDRVAFHCWLQWLVELQLGRAGQETSLMQDLAIGVDSCGADAWQWQDQLARGVRVGAPPDEFVPQGQDWGLPPFLPQALRAAGYQPFIDTLRSSLHPGGGLRVDHVMGLFRLWWIPPGAEPRDGAYVRYPAHDLLHILALESMRRRCLVVGEDLGTVEPAVRSELRRRRILSYRLAWFEDEPPRRYPALAMAALSTHDLPTAAGVWSGADLEEQRRAGRPLNEDAEARLAARLRRLAPLGPTASERQVVESAYAALGAAPCKLVAATLDDAALAIRRPNLPGDLGRPNWSIPLPRTLEQLRRDALPRSIATVLQRRRR